MSTIRKFFNKKNIFITGGTGTFGTAMIGLGIVFGYSGVMFDDGFDFEALIFTALFAMPMVITGYLNLEEQS